VAAPYRRPCPGPGDTAHGLRDPGARRPTQAPGAAEASTLQNPPVAMTIATPELLRSAHGRWLQALEQAAADPPVASLARRLLRTLAPHLEREEQFAFPALALLPLVGLGKIQADMNEALPLTERLRTELPRLLAEHRAIVAEAQKLGRAARRAGRTELVRTVEEVLAQTELEEEILYPGALLVGDCLRDRLGR